MTITTLFHGSRRKTNNRMQHVVLSIIFYHDYHPSHLLTIMETTKTKVTQTVKQIQIHQTSTGKLFTLQPLTESMTSVGTSSFNSSLHLLLVLIYLCIKRKCCFELYLSASWLHERMIHHKTQFMRT